MCCRMRKEETEVESKEMGRRPRQVLKEKSQLEMKEGGNAREGKKGEGKERRHCER